MRLHVHAYGERRGDLGSSHLEGNQGELLQPGARLVMSFDADQYINFIFFGVQE